MPEQQRHLWTSLTSSLTGRDGRLLVISIRGFSPMFTELCERAAAGDPASRFIEYAAPAGCALDDPSAWLAANPGLAEDGVKSWSALEDLARHVLLSPGNQRAFRSEHLNQRLDPARQTIVLPTDWMKIVRAPEELPGRVGPAVVGLDIGHSSSMTCACIIWSSGLMETLGAFGDVPPLAERSQIDNEGDRYPRMLEEGALQVFTGRVTPAAAFVRYLADRLAGVQILAIAADRYQWSEVATALQKAGVNWSIQWRNIGSGGASHHSLDIRSFQKLVRVVR